MGSLDPVPRANQPLESRVTINVQDTFEPFEMRHRTFGLAVRREQIDRRRWCGTAPRSLVAGIDPQPSCLCAPTAPDRAPGLACRRQTGCQKRTRACTIARAAL